MKGVILTSFRVAGITGVTTVGVRCAGAACTKSPRWTRGYTGTGRQVGHRMLCLTTHQHFSVSSIQHKVPTAYSPDPLARHHSQ